MWGARIVLDVMILPTLATDAALIMCFLPLIFHYDGISGDSGGR